MPRKNKISGIYKITNASNNKIYIGSAVDVHNRFATHKKDLKRNQHHNTHIQAAWNKYGESSFVFEIIEIVSDVNDLIYREQVYLDSFKPYDRLIGYNKQKIAGSSLGVFPSEETKKKQSIAAKARTDRVYGEDHPCAKLTWIKVRKIRKLYSSGKFTHEKLGKMFGVDRRYIGSILAAQRWIEKDTVPLKNELALLTQDQIQNVLDMIDQGISWRQIEIKIGHAYRAIQKFLKRIGIDLKIKIG